MFQEDQGAFYRKTQGTEQLRGEVPDMEKFEEFWGGIWEDETPKMDAYCCKEDKRKSKKCAGIYDH